MCTTLVIPLRVCSIMQCQKRRQGNVEKPNKSRSRMGRTEVRAAASRDKLRFVVVLSLMLTRHRCDLGQLLIYLYGWEQI